MSERNEYIEYGYRLEDGVEEWPVDHGTDGVWIPSNHEHDIPVIDVYDSDKMPVKIRAALAQAGVDGVVLRRTVVTIVGDAEAVPET